MDAYTVHTALTPLEAELTVPGDKSISHRAVMFAGLVRGISHLKGLNEGKDVLATRQIFSALGTRYAMEGDTAIVSSNGLDSWDTKENHVFDCMNSGTTTRLLTGLFAGIPGFRCTLDGDDSLRSRPMERVIDPLEKMGAVITSENGKLPLKIKGQALTGIDYQLPVASAQVKSALMLASLRVRGKTLIREKSLTRDHTERFFHSLKLPLFSSGLIHKILPLRHIPGGFTMTIPGDPSSAAFWTAAALCIPGSQLLIRNISLNLGRITFLKVLKRAGARIRIFPGPSQADPIGDIEVQSSRLRALRVNREERASVIDEYPILALIASQASEDSEFFGIRELRYKESDRIKAIINTLNTLGVNAQEYPAGFSVRGRSTIRGGSIDTHDDHRIAMTAAIAGLISENPVEIRNPDVATVSYPGFYDTLERIGAGK